MARRPYVIVVHAGDRSQHERWVQGGSRNFDIVITQSAGQAQGLLANYMKLVGDYERVALASDNFAVDARWWNTLLHTCDWFGLDLGHPAVMNHGWEAMRPQAGSLMRYVSRVDGLAPVFSRRALERLQSTFAQGLPNADLSSRWSELLPWPDYRCAVVDTVHVRNTAGMPASAEKIQITEHARLRLAHEELQER